MNRIPPLILALCLSYTCVRSQDIHLSQFFATPLLRNPALAGIFNGDIRLQAVYRNQWQSTGYPYQTNVLNGEYKTAVGSGDDFITFGLSCFYDEAGIMKLKTLQVMPAINFHKSLSGTKSSYLSAGFMAGFIQRSFNGKNLTFDNQYTAGRYNPSASSGEQFTGLTTSLFDIALGLSYNTEVGENGVIYLGGSYWHFNKPKANFLQETIQLQPKWQLNAGYKVRINDYLEARLEMNYLKQGNYSETIGGGLLSYSLDEMLDRESGGIGEYKIGAGLFMRWDDAVIPVVQVSYGRVDVNFSYDVNTSQLKSASQGRGGFEIGIGFRAFTSNQNSSLNSVRCPSF